MTNLEINLQTILTEKDEKILPENIKKDVSILGVTGNYEGEYNAKVENCGNRYLYQYITSISQIDTSNVTDMTYMFFNFSNLIEIPQMDTSNVTTMERAFSGCKKLVTIPQLDTRNLSKSTYALYSAFSGCDNLSDESLNNILAMCINATKMDTKTLAYMGLTFAQANKCKTLSNYSAFTTAGWTTGY